MPSKTQADVGYTRDDVESPVFLRAAARVNPKLIAPTNRKFDPADWRAALDDASTPRDADLIAGALLIGRLKDRLRHDVIDDLFVGIAAPTVVRLAVAAANRATLLSDRAMQKLHAASAAKGEIGDVLALSQTKFKPSSISANLSFDDANTAIIDALPHWFAEAKDQPVGRETGFVPYRLVVARAEIAMGYEHLFRDIWQELLWEPWRLRRRSDDGHLGFEPKNAVLQAKWRAWDWRDQMLLMQAPTLDQHLRMTMGTDEPAPFPKTIVKARRTRSGTSIRTGPLTDKARIMAITRGELLDHCYLAAFLDEVFPRSGVSVRLLERAIVILQDAVRLLLLGENNVELHRYDDVARFSCPIDRQELVAVLADCLAISLELADRAVICLTSDPAELGPLFDKGVWHRPLVALGGGELLLVAGAILHGSPIRRASLWLKDAGLGDRLSTTSQGLRFEADVLKRISSDVYANPIFKGVDRVVARLDRIGETGEEIDMVIRVGTDVIVCEIKSFLGPSDAIERHNYLEKIQAACAQASRKAAWLGSDKAAQVRVFGAELAGDARLHPLVVVNQSAGCGLQYDGAPVADFSYLSLLLSDGSFLRGSVLRRDIPLPEVVRETLYSDAAEFSAELPRLLRENPTMKRLEAAIRWEYQSVAVPGFMLHLAVPNMEQEVYTKAGLAGVSV